MRSNYHSTQLLCMQTEKGRTALHHAAGATQTRVVYELIKAGVDVHLKVGERESAHEREREHVHTCSALVREGEGGGGGKVCA